MEAARAFDASGAFPSHPPQEGQQQEKKEEGEGQGQGPIADDGKEVEMEVEGEMEEAVMVEGEMMVVAAYDAWEGGGEASVQQQKKEEQEGQAQEHPYALFHAIRGGLNHRKQRVAGAKRGMCVCVVVCMSGEARGR